MKRIGKLYAQIATYNNCRRAIERASIGKSGRGDVQKVTDHIHEYTLKLFDMLENLTFEPSAYRIVTVVDGLQKKTRDVQVPRFFPDQCMHHALMNVLEPELEKRFYFWSCGSRKNKGIAAAKKGVEKATLHSKRRAKYAVKLDITKCYASIDNERLMAAFERLIKDKKTLWLIGKIVRSCKGLPIGNYTSAWFCNFFLTPIDRLVKEKHKIRYFVRYIDDMVMIDTNKRKLRKAVMDVAQYGSKELGVTFHPNWCIFRIRKNGEGKRNRPIDFVGYQFCLGYTRLRKRNALALMRQSKRIQRRQEANAPVCFRAAAGFLSRCGQLKHCGSVAMRKKYVEPVNTEKLKEVIRNEGTRKRLPFRRVSDRGST